MDNEKRYALIGMSVLAVVALVLASIFFVQDGTRSVVLRFGEVRRIANPGLNFKVPFMESTVSYEIRTRKLEVPAVASSNDLQDVSSVVVVQYNLIPDKVDEVYKSLGTRYEQRVIAPAIQEAVKSSTAKFNATELITKRKEVKDLVKKKLKERLFSIHANVSNVDIVSFKFSSSFNVAIEEKVKAEQEALKEKNRLQRVRFESEQKIVQAEAEARKIQLEAEALKGNPELVEKIYAESYRSAVEKWDGRLPTHFVPNSSVPFINLNSK